MIKVITCLHPTRAAEWRQMLVRMITAQTVLPNEWIICGKNWAGISTPDTIWTKMFETTGTHEHNLACAFSQVDDDDILIFMEDDDYYGPTWIGHCVKRLNDKSVYSERPLYYDITTRYNKCITKAGALGHTAIRGEMWKEILIAKLENGYQSDFHSFGNISQAWTGNTIGIKKNHPLLYRDTPEDKDWVKLTALVKDPEILNFYKGFYAT